MKKFLGVHAGILAFIAAVMVIGSVFSGCSGDDSDDDSVTATYGGSYTVDGKTYASLALTGSSSSGSAKLIGEDGTLSGSYSTSDSDRKAGFIAFSGGYSLTFGATPLYMEFPSSSSVNVYSDSTKGTSLGSGKGTAATYSTDALYDSESGAYAGKVWMFFYGDNKFWLGGICADGSKNEVATGTYSGNPASDGKITITGTGEESETLTISGGKLELVDDDDPRHLVTYTLTRR